MRFITGVACSAVALIVAAGVPLATGGAKRSPAATTPPSVQAPEYMPGTPLKIPGSATVLTLTGLNCNLTDYIDDQLTGVFERPPYKRVRVLYSACINKGSIPDGVTKLDAALAKYPGRKIVLAHSQGAQVASRWMREHANDPKSPSADDLTFVLTGNPLRSNGKGYIIGRKEIGGTVGLPTPTDTKWPIVDVARRYDGWADYPDDAANKEAVTNAEKGKSSYHTRYADVDITAPTHTISRSGNTTYVLTKERPVTADKDDADATSNVVGLRARIESAYRRPPEDTSTKRPGCADGVDPTASAGRTMPGTGLPIPASATVLTLSGLNYNTYYDMDEKFRGVFSRAPYCMIQINYPASLSTTSITKGVSALDEMLRLIPGPKIVLAQSQGAQVSSRWMRQFANDPTAPRAGDVTFLLTGNPLRSAGGGAAIGVKEVDKVIGVATPTHTPWPIIDVARRYDGWADAPSDTKNSVAVKNADAGKNELHKAYDAVDITASTHTVWRTGNTTYVLTKEDALPFLTKEKNVPADVVSQVRAQIEAGYSRPASDPKPKPQPVTNATWLKKLKSWGVLLRS